MSAHALSRLSRLLLGLPWLLAGCSSGPSVVVSLSNVPQQVDALTVLVSLNGSPSRQPPTFHPQAQERFSFGLRLPQGSAGAAVISVGAFTQAGCLLTTGTQTLQITPDDREKVVDLALSPPPAEYADTCKKGAPVIRSITQDFVQGKKVLRILGWGFQAHTQVLVSTVPAAGLVVKSVEELQVDEPPLPRPSGKTSTEVLVQNPDRSQDQGTADLYTVTFAGAAANSYPLGPGGYPEAIALADLNGDGKPDVVVAGSILLDPGFISVFLNQGDGHFPQTPQTYSIPGGASAVTIADLNGDKLPDLVVSNTSKGTISVLFNQGQGVFPRAPMTFPAGNLPYSLALSDVDGDGRLDVVVVNDPYSSSGASNISVLHNQGQGQLGAPVALLNTPFAELGALQVQDLNGDDRPDIVVSQVVPVVDGQGKVSIAGGVGVLLNQGGGKFPGLVSTYVSQGSLGGVVVGDLSHTGRADLAVSGIMGSDTTKDGVVSILFNGGAGLFAGNNSDYSAGQRPFSLALGDLDGDGRLDIAVTNPVDGSAGLLTVLLNQGSGRFPRGGLPSYPIGTGAAAVAVADLDGDGRMDLALATEGNPKDNQPGAMMVLLNTTR